MRLNLSWKDVEQMYNLTRSAQNFFSILVVCFLTSLLINLMMASNYTDQAEYGENWYWAYNSYKIDGRFPNPYDN